MTDDGFPSAAEIRRLEAEADALLKQDAKESGFVIGRRPKKHEKGYSAYARAYGITTKKTLETTYKHEAAVSILRPGDQFTMEEKLDFFASRMDKIEPEKDNREEA